MMVRNLRLKLLAIAAFTAVAAGIFLLLFRAAGGEIGGSRRYAVSVVVPNAYNLVPNADVRAAGVKVGRVADIAPRGSAADLRLELDRRVAPVGRDARVLVRTKTLVGESYVALDPGSRRRGTLPDGGRLSADAAGTSVQLDDILGTLDPRTRRAVRRSLRGSAAGLAGHGDELNASLGALRDTARSGGRLTAALVAQRPQLAALVDDTGTVLDAIGRREADLQRLVRGARTTAGAVRARDARLREALGLLPATLRQAETSLGVLQRFALRATPVVADVTASSGDLATAVRALEPAARTGRRAVDELRRAVPVGDALLAGLTDFAAAARPAVGGLDDSLRQVNPVLRYLAPYSREIGAFFANQGAWNEVTDATGHVGRVQGVLSERAFAQTTPETKRAIEALLDVGILRKLHDQGENSYPAPGTVARPRPGHANFTRVQEDRP